MYPVLSPHCQKDVRALSGIFCSCCSYFASVIVFFSLDVANITKEKGLFLRKSTMRPAIALGKWSLASALRVLLPRNERRAFSIGHCSTGCLAVSGIPGSGPDDPTLFNPKFYPVMKRLLFITAIFIINSLALTSCTYNDTADNESLYDTQGTGGEDEHIIPPESEDD